MAGKDSIVSKFNIFLLIVISIIASHNAIAKRSSLVKQLKYSILAPGIKYEKILYGRNRNIVHILEVDLNNPKCKIAVLKAKGKNTELQKLHDIVREHDSLSANLTIGAINGSFWRKYSNFPIGPTIIDGEIVELNTHKGWSSIFFDAKGRPYIDNFKIEATVSYRDYAAFQIDAVNRRKDSAGFVLYNRFRGDTIPYISAGTIEKELEEAIIVNLKDATFKDSTEFDFDLEAKRQQLKNKNRIADMEYNLPKIALTYLGRPSLNKDIACIVTKISSGLIEVPAIGCVLSFGYGIPYDIIPAIGDTLIINYSTNVEKNVEFINGLSGTPRLVRNGKAKHEAYKEGSRGRRFIGRSLTRTAIGTDKSRQKLYLVAVEPSNRRRSTNGASLKQLAYIMKAIGCHDAMNLDGGGSTVMVIDGKNIMSPGAPERSRKISVAIAVSSKNTMKNTGVLKNIFK